MSRALLLLENDFRRTPAAITTIDTYRSTFGDVRAMRSGRLNIDVHRSVFAANHPVNTTLLGLHISSRRVLTVKRGDLLFEKNSPTRPVA